MTEAKDTGPLGKLPPRWPKVVGTIGIIVGVIMFLDNVDDLLLIPFIGSEESWSRLLGPELAEFMVRAMPPVSWAVSSSLVGMGLAILLLVGSIRLRRCRQSGVTFCRTWSWLAIVWAAIEIARTIRWLEVYGDEIPGAAHGGWQGFAAFGIVVALVVLLAYPVFLLAWFSRSPVQEEYLSWPE